MSETTNTPFPAVAEAVIGAGLVQTTDARELHAFLKVGRDFTTWIEARIRRYGFVENVDYVAEAAPPIGGAGNRGARTEYHLTLDMAKELAMVENNQQGRAARRYFIECERRAKAPALDARAVGDMVDGFLARQFSKHLPALVREQIAAELARKDAVPALDFGSTVSAYQVIEAAGIPVEDRQRGTAQMVTRRLVAFCAERRIACFRTPAEVNPSRPFRFPRDVVSEWLLGTARGLELIRSQVDRMKAKKAARGRGVSQGALRLV